MSYKYYIADVFTDKIFSGAQVAVFPHAGIIADDEMALIARELNLTETVFLSQGAAGENNFRMRVFSPKCELNFAGHPIIAAAYILVECDLLTLQGEHTSIVFKQNSGDVQSSVTITEGRSSFVQFTRTVTPVVDYYVPMEAELGHFLGIDVGYIDNKKYSTRLVSCDVPYLVVPLFYYETLREVQFDFTAWSQSIAPQTAAQEILLVSLKTPHQDSDFAVRLVGPNIGLHDDPPVGSAMPALASYLCSFDHVKKGTYTFSVERGDNAIRRSVLNLEMDHKGEGSLAIRVGGKAVIVSEGTFYSSKVI